MRKMYPVIEKPYKHLVSEANYDPATHTVRIRKSSAESKGIKSILQHEDRHAIQTISNLALVRKKARQISKHNKLIENPLTREKFSESTKIRQSIENQQKNWVEATNINPKLRAFYATMQNFLSIGKNPFKQSRKAFLEQLKRQKSTRRIYQAHGEDGILLMWANPPKTLDALELKEWERGMVSNGYLKPIGGFTKKGLQLWREKVQAQAIWEFLEKTKKARSPRGLIERAKKIN